MVDLGDHADSLANSFGIFLTKPSNTATNAMPSFPLVSYQPLRSLYWFAYKAWIQIRLPFWHLYLCVFPCPHEKWSRAATIAAWLGREESELFAHLGITEPLSLEPELVQDSRPGAVTSAFDVISPGPLSLYRGPVDHQTSGQNPLGSHPIRSLDTIVRQIRSSSFTCTAAPLSGALAGPSSWPSSSTRCCTRLVPPPSTHRSIVCRATAARTRFRLRCRTP